MSGSAKLSGALTAAALSMLALLTLAPLSSGKRASHPSARTARTISLNETGHLHLTSKHNFTLNEQGSASALSSLALMTATALAILAIPGWLASSVPASLALQD
jgi:hypothetical protein